MLLARNARVYITSRDRVKGQQAVDELRKISEAIHVLHLDLSDLYSVRRAGNAGYMSSSIMRKLLSRVSTC